MKPRLPLRPAPVAAVLAAAALALAPPPSHADGDTPSFGDAFWKHWGDGRAEICTYDLTFPRYGAPRSGTAVAIFVTETFSLKDRVKADPGNHPPADEVPAMKLNLVQDFATGIYDYNLMTSSFVQLSERDRRSPGAVLKITFSSQEWCGHVFHELIPNGNRVKSVLHSYFDGEADETRTADLPRNALFEDGLFHWARGWSAPVVAPGESRDVRLLRSTEISRLGHLPSAWEDATVSRDAKPSTVETPAGSFGVNTYRVDIRGDRARTWTFSVEAAPPHRIVRWEASDGRRADLVASTRTAYWTKNGPGDEKELEALGLAPRPPRTP
ncbi:hypothetical protein K8I85_00600 [bacterium]|nr:hypothetical protein [bacterium]